MAIRLYSALGMRLPPIIIMAHDYSHALSTINACWVYHVESVSKMGLVLSITFLQCVELAHSSICDWKDIFILIEQFYYVTFWHNKVKTDRLIKYHIQVYDLKYTIKKASVYR